MTASSILITGCSSGIGLCAAEILKKRGYRVFATARKSADVEKLNTQGFESILLDVNDTASMQHALQEITKRTHGNLDALFNNSGFMQMGAIEDLTRDMDRAQFETNVFGPMELIRLVLPIMRKQGHGRIIQNSSITGILTFPFYGSYSASKFALEAFSGILRQELYGTNIHVSLINPGPIVSKLRDHTYQQFQKTIKQHASLYEEKYKKLEQIYFTSNEKPNWLIKPPEAVVKKLMHALESTRPKTHYYVGWPTQTLVLLKRLLPDRALDWVLNKVK